jgi:membrane protein implicated in regulation of membrane protease activity
MMTYVWAAVIVGAMLLEGITLALVAIWFVPGALVGLVLSILTVSLPWQVGAFLVTTVLTFILGLKIRRKKSKTNVDALIGQVVVVTEEVNNIEGRGAGKLHGQFWTIRSQDASQTLVPGDLAVVVAIEGVKLICRKQ